MYEITASSEIVAPPSVVRELLCSPSRYLEVADPTDAMLEVPEGATLPQLNPDGVAWVNQGLGSLGEFWGVRYEPEPTVEF